MDSSPNFVLIFSSALFRVSVFLVLVVFVFLAAGFVVFFFAVFLGGVIGLNVEREINNLFALLSVVRVHLYYSISCR